MLSLIDSDPLVYGCGFAAQKNWRHVSIDGTYLESFHTKKGLNQFLKEHSLPEEEVTITEEQTYEPLSHCLHNLKKQIESILENTKATAYKLFLSGDTNFRNQIATIKPYKGN